MKQGFTLVELSIVLVIIGLLIGGILAAQSMIRTTRIQAQIRQVQQLDTAITNFKMKFNQLPGDSTLFDGVGNNDGKITSDPNFTYSSVSFVHEVKYVWIELQRGIGLYSNFTFDTTDYCNNGPCSFSADNAHIIPAAIDTKTGIEIAYDSSLVPSYFNGYNFSSFNNNGNAITSRPTITCIDALAVDEKLDDGNSDRGSVITDFTSDCFAANGYNISDSIGTTTMEIKILSQTE